MGVNQGEAQSSHRNLYGDDHMTEVESMQFKHYSAERLKIESIASRLTPSENAFRLWLMDYTINEGAPYNIHDGAKMGRELRDLPALISSLAGKRAIVLDTNGNVSFVYPVSALPTNHKVTLSDGRAFFAMCAIDALGAAFTFQQDIDVDSACSECGQRIHVEIKDGLIAGLSPPTAHVLHVDLNKTSDWAGSC